MSWGVDRLPIAGIQVLPIAQPILYLVHPRPLCLAGEKAFELPRSTAVADRSRPPPILGVSAEVKSISGTSLASLGSIEAGARAWNSLSGLPVLTVWSRHPRGPAADADAKVLLPRPGFRDGRSRRIKKRRHSNQGSVQCRPRGATPVAQQVSFHPFHGCRTVLQLQHERPRPPACLHQHPPHTQRRGVDSGGLPHVRSVARPSAQHRGRASLSR